MTIAQLKMWCFPSPRKLSGALHHPWHWTTVPASFTTERCCLFLNLIKMGHTELSLCVWLLSGRVMSIRFTHEISSFPRFYKTILIRIIYVCVIYIICICVHLCIYIYSYICMCFPALVVKNPPANAGDVRDTGSIPGSERSPGGGHGNPLQYSS